MSGNNSHGNTLTIGKYVFAGPILKEPPCLTTRTTSVMPDLRMWDIACRLGELGWAAHILYAREWLQGEKMTKEEDNACKKDLVKSFRFYCPHVKKDVTNMELHAAMGRETDVFRGRFTKRDVQAVFWAYQKWLQVPETRLSSRRLKVWAGRGLSMIMASRCYREAVVKALKRPNHRDDR